jgi:hypothetical protein
MSDVSVRMHTERDELALRLQKISAFIYTEDFRRLKPEAQELIRQQKEHMNNYYDVLETRIRRFYS